LPSEQETTTKCAEVLRLRKLREAFKCLLDCLADLASHWSYSWPACNNFIDIRLCFLTVRRHPGCPNVAGMCGESACKSWPYDRAANSRDLANRRLQPLGHLSAYRNVVGVLP